MVASPYEMLDDLATCVDELQRVHRKNPKQVEVLKNLITNLSCELEYMGFQDEVRKVLNANSVSNTEGVL